MLENLLLALEKIGVSQKMTRRQLCRYNVFMAVTVNAAPVINYQRKAAGL